MIQNDELQKVVMAGMQELIGAACAAVTRHGHDVATAAQELHVDAMRIGLRITLDLRRAFPLSEEEAMQVISNFCGAFLLEFAQSRRLNLLTARELNATRDQLTAERAKTPTLREAS